MPADAVGDSLVVGKHGFWRGRVAGEPDSKGARRTLAAPFAVLLPARSTFQMITFPFVAALAIHLLKAAREAP